MIRTSLMPWLAFGLAASLHLSAPAEEAPWPAKLFASLYRVARVV